MVLYKHQSSFPVLDLGISFFNPRILPHRNHDQPRSSPTSSMFTPQPQSLPPSSKFTPQLQNSPHLRSYLPNFKVHPIFDVPSPTIHVHPIFEVIAPQLQSSPPFSTSTTHAPFKAYCPSSCFLLHWISIGCDAV